MEEGTRSQEKQAPSRSWIKQENWSFSRTSRKNTALLTTWFQPCENHLEPPDLKNCNKIIFSYLKSRSVVICYSRNKKIIYLSTHSSFLHSPTINPHHLWGLWLDITSSQKHCMTTQWPIPLCAAQHWFPISLIVIIWSEWSLCI